MAAALDVDVTGLLDSLRRKPGKGALPASTHGEANFRDFKLNFEAAAPGITPPAGPAPKHDPYIALTMQLEPDPVASEEIASGETPGIEAALRDVASAEQVVADVASPEISAPESDPTAIDAGEEVVVEPADVDVPPELAAAALHDTETDSADPEPVDGAVAAPAQPILTEVSGTIAKAANLPGGEQTAETSAPPATDTGHDSAGQIAAETTAVDVRPETTASDEVSSNPADIIQTAALGVVPSVAALPTEKTAADKPVIKGDVALDRAGTPASDADVPAPVRTPMDLVSTKPVSMTEPYGFGMATTAEMADMAAAVDSQSGTDKPLQVFTSALTPTTPANPTASPAQVQPAMSPLPAPAILVAAPEEIVDIVKQKLGGDDGRDRIRIQLDPPELGRVSIDFKFDAQGLQHVTVTGETPEAMRRLKMLHMELTQSLQQHGLSSEGMTFQQNTGRGGQTQVQDLLSQRMAARSDDAAGADSVMLATASRRPRMTAAGLDIKL